MPIHLLIALNVPRWFIKCIDKIRRGFLWKGRMDARGSHCPVAWLRVTRPLQYGGLGIHDLEVMSWALRMRWSWLKKTDQSRPWAQFDVQLPAKAKALFSISVITILDDGRNTSFWTDRWIHGKALNAFRQASWMERENNC
ncbi:hypothetical protein PR202_gb09722 [Eleusine coracana subsp. coracana]|uniref:Uncharacterized protein n=1 Tax=Eleusine coracana subsp. coracana TaxID=191504 RepID=A0AAV5EIJ5_ELECO|nr:hypothetical protein PR202_gb09722 [Eleusine coracana subsp. coracana]